MVYCKKKKNSIRYRTQMVYTYHRMITEVYECWIEF